jgi:hypothetical protein
LKTALEHQETEETALDVFFTQISGKGQFLEAGTRKAESVQR